jgi:DNA-binding protein H-NS
MNILDQANKIVNERNEEKERQYGPFEEGMEKAAKIASLIANKEITSDDMYICMMALKLSRQSYNKKEDNMLDLVAYIGAWQNKINKEDDTIQGHKSISK